ncbi:peptidoglycan-binding domain-containing protein [Hyphomonas sp.]
MIDDRIGPATTAAIRSFQWQAGEAPTGSLTRAQLRALALPILP